MTERYDDAYARLDNWGRWARNDSPRIGYPSRASVFGDMIHDSADKEGWGSGSGDSPPPIDIKDARAIDVQIMRLAICHVLTIKRHWYNLRPVSRDDVGAAVRAMADRLYPISVALRVSESQVE